MSQILEGTWEEIAARAEEFNGHRLRVIILDAKPEKPETEGKTLAELFEGRIGLVSFEPDDVSERTEELFGQIIEEKYRRGKL